MGRFSVHPGELEIHSELVSILDIAPKGLRCNGRSQGGRRRNRPVAGSLVPRFRSGVQAERKQVAWKFGRAAQ